jgi:catechol 2,3-dioxygenase-like lactoylglutathione lyase family enzyme
VLQHVSLEVPPDQARATVEFWRLLGFEAVDAPEPVAGFVTWLERDGTQIHLIHTEEASVPALGHAAVVVDDFERTLERVAAGGHEVSESRSLWGARRAFAVAPGGHRVELMESPPPRHR